MTSTPEGSRPDLLVTTRSLDLWDLKPEEQIERLAGDVALAQDLRQAGWRGPEWDFVANILAEYGLGVIGSWLRKGGIDDKCREKRIRCPVLPDWVQTDHHECDDLASSVVAKALQQFRDVVLPKGLWDPAKGAALSTYFIGQCLIQYPNVAQKWINDRKSAGADVVPTTTEDLDELLPDGDTRRREEEFIEELVVAAILSSARTDQARLALEMRYFGYSQKEIAVKLGSTEQAVAQMLGREKRHLAEQAKAQLKASR